MPSEDQVCKNCIFSHDPKPENLSSQLECRRHPPQVTGAGSSNNVRSKWPKMNDLDWCGDFRSRMLKTKTEILRGFGAA